MLNFRLEGHWEFKFLNAAALKRVQVGGHASMR